MRDRHHHVRPRQPTGKVTIIDVAKEAGVSAATAARVLGNYGSVSENTRDIVLKAADKLRYVPNALARSMVKLTTQTLGLVVPDIRNAFFGAIAQSVAKQAKSVGYRIIMCDTGADFSTEISYLKDLNEQRVDGILLASSLPTSRTHDYLPSITCPVVLIDRSIDQAGLDTVRSDHRAGAYQAVQHLLSLGHRRIAIILGTGTEAVHNERYEGYASALKDAGVDIDDVLVKKRDWETGLSAVDELLDLENPPTAIFSTNNVVTVGVLSDLKRLGKQIPEDVAVISFDEIGLAPLLSTPLTEVAQDPALIGSTAMDILMSRITNKDEDDISPQEVIFQPSLIVRESCGERAMKENESLPSTNT